MEHLYHLLPDLSVLGVVCIVFLLRGGWEGTSTWCGCCVAGGLLLGSEASKSFLQDCAACPRGAWGADRSVGAF